MAMKRSRKDDRPKIVDEDNKPWFVRVRSVASYQVMPASWMGWVWTGLFVAFALCWSWLGKSLLERDPVIWTAIFVAGLILYLGVALKNSRGVDVRKLIWKEGEWK